MHRQILIAVLMAFGLTGTGTAQDDGVFVETLDLGGGINMLITNRGGNVGVSVGEDGVFMIDTQFGNITPSLDAAQRAVSGDQDVDIVLNTHLHSDHVLGNAYFADRGAVIIAHESVRPALENPVKANLSGRTPGPLTGSFLPTLSVNSGDSITMNGQTARFYHEPDAHTAGDIWVYFEQANVIHTGDLLFSGWFPYIDLDNGGTVPGFIAGMQSMINIADEDTKVISGHGPLSSRADLQASVDMLTEAHARIKAHVDARDSYSETLAAESLADFHEDWNWRFITTERMIWTIYRDLTGEIPQMDDE